MTTDVECHSFETNTRDEAVAKRVEQEALPELLRLYRKHRIKSTFFFTVRFAELSPKSVMLVRKAGHEVGCHGYDHTDYYDQMAFEEQLALLKKCKTKLEKIAKTEILSFRAPALRINKSTVIALEKAGFRFDSSVSSQRIDGPFTLGAMNKLGWLYAPRRPYYLSYKNPFLVGNSKVLEVPVSAFIWGFTGTHMRLSPVITAQLQRILQLEARLMGKPIVFLFHPNECLSFKRKRTEKRGSLFSDYLRHKLKMKNLGKTALELLDKLLSRCPQNTNFVTIKDYKPW